jgi:hypothetical protein
MTGAGRVPVSGREFVVVTNGVKSKTATGCSRATIAKTAERLKRGRPMLAAGHAPVDAPLAFIMPTIVRNSTCSDVMSFVK